MRLQKGLKQQSAWLLLLGMAFVLSISFLSTQEAEAAVDDFVINEFQADPASDLTGDANGDGVRDASQDEFVELVNISGSSIDISGWTLSDAASVRHTFAANTIVPDGCGVVVFGGGTPTGTFGGMEVQTASTGLIGLNNGGDTITLNDGVNDVDTYTYGGEGSNNQSITLDPDLTGSYVQHSTATGSAGALYSPGTKIDGSQFSGCPTVDIPPIVSSTSPSNGQISVALDADVTINFSEAVTVQGDWFSISCTTSGAITEFDQTGGPISYTMVLPAPLEYSEDCTVTITASLVTDQDDMPDNMAENYVFSFSAVDLLSCETGLTPIYTIQGIGDDGAMTGEVITTGIVVGDYQDGFEGDDGDLNGFFIQDETGDANAATSDGVFVYDPNNQLDVAIGDKVVVRGNAGEFFGLTQVSTSSSNGLIQDCGTDGTITPTLVTLPIASMDTWEAVEGMLVTVQAASGDLTVTDSYNLGRFGSFYMSSGGRIYQYTELNAPTDATANDAYQLQAELRTVVIDDGIGYTNPDPVKYPAPEFSASNPVRAGYTLSGVTGVVDYNFGEYKIQPDMTNYPFSLTVSNPRTESPTVDGALRVASFNVLNYFDGPAFPTPRGADSAEEFTRQTDKIVNALIDINADVVGLMEIENDASPGAVGTLVDALNAVAGAGTYSYIDTGIVGTDAIRQALIYKTATVIPIGNFAVLDSSVDATFNDDKNRPVIAQTFADLNGARFTVVVNHLKSKGSNCNDLSDPDTGDGQGNCNLIRTAATTAIVNWLATDPTGSGDSDFLIIGDLNSYAMEDPMMVLYDAGYTNLAKAADVMDYSYQFFGQWGTLDHALSTPTLTAQVAGVTIWHINADEPVALDYNLEDKLEQFYNADQFRSSDHDPVIVGLDLVPEIELVSPSGIDETNYGEPEFVWNGIGEALDYHLWVAKTGSDTPKIFIKDIALDNCEDFTCSILPVDFGEENRIPDGDYDVWLGADRDGKDTVWFGPFNFTLDGTPSNVPTLRSTTGIDSFTPTLLWTVEGASAYASWFEVYVAKTGSVKTPVIRQWVKRVDACGSAYGASCSYQITLEDNDTEYRVWMRGWGPSGYTVNGLEASPQWTGPDIFTIAVPLPSVPENIVVDPRQGRPQVSWDDDPYATHFRLYIGGNPADAGGPFSKWYQSDDVCEKGTCVVEPPIDWMAINNPFKVWMQAYGAAGYGEWTAAPIEFDLPTDAPAAPTNFLPIFSEDSDPTFTWDSMANATWYRLVLKNSEGQQVYKKWVLGYNVGCGDASGTCSWTDPAIGGDTLPAGTYSKTLMALGPGGTSDEVISDFFYKVAP